MLCRGFPYFGIMTESRFTSFFGKGPTGLFLGLGQILKKYRYTKETKFNVLLLKPRTENPFDS